MEIIILPAMPVTAVGKISKPALRVDATTRVARDIATQVLGATQPFQFKVDDSGRWLKVVFTTPCCAAELAGITQRLRAAFESFEFETAVVRAD